MCGLFCSFDLPYADWLHAGWILQLSILVFCIACFGLIRMAWLRSVASGESQLQNAILSKRVAALGYAGISPGSSILRDHQFELIAIEAELETNLQNAKCIEDARERRMAEARAYELARLEKYQLTIRNVITYPATTDAAASRMGHWEDKCSISDNTTSHKVSVN